MALPLIQDQPDPTFWETRAGDFLPTSSWDVAAASFEQGVGDSATMTMAGMMAQKTIDEMPGQKTLSVEELNRKYMGTGITWTGPKKEQVADFIFEEHQKRNVLQNRMALGQGGFVEGSLGIGANMAAHLLDPAEFAANIAGGALIRGASFLPEVFRGATFGSAVARGALEGALTQAPMEALEIVRNRQMELDVSMAQSMSNIAMGAALGSVVEGGMHGIGSLLAKRALGTTKNSETMIESATAQLMDGRRPTLDPFSKVFERERFGMGPRPEVDYSGRSSYTHKPIDASLPVAAKVYLGTSSTAERMAEITAGQYKNSVREFGNGIYMVDDPHVANGYAASSFNDSPGVIHEMDLSNAKLLNAQEQIPVTLRKELEKLDAPELSKAFKNREVLTPEQIYKALEENPRAIEAINQHLKTQGYDGLTFNEVSPDGTARHNGFMLFEESKGKLAQSGAYNGDPRFVGGLHQNDVDNMIRSYNAKENEMFWSAKDEADLREFETRTTETDPLDDTELAENFKAAREQVELMTLNAEDSALVKFVDDLSKTQQALSETTLKAIASCLRKG